MFGMIWLMKVGVGGQVSGPELAKNMISLSQAVDLILLEFARVAAEFAQTDEYDHQGYDSPSPGSRRTATFLVALPRIASAPASSSSV
jgi:hypothetical protein